MLPAARRPICSAWRRRRVGKRDGVDGREEAQDPYHIFEWTIIDEFFDLAEWNEYQRICPTRDEIPTITQ
ncbi:unnamed protein product [Urochloa humidicola]